MTKPSESLCRRLWFWVLVSTLTAYTHRTLHPSQFLSIANFPTSVTERKFLFCAVLNSVSKYFWWHLRWLDWIFEGVYFPTLSIYFVSINKNIGKRLPLLYYIKMKFCCHPCFIDIGVAMAVSWRHNVFYFPLFSSVPGFFFQKSLKGVCNSLSLSIMAKFEQII